jgi:hypothetical protein
LDSILSTVFYTLSEQWPLDNVTESAQCTINHFPKVKLVYKQSSRQVSAVSPQAITVYVLVSSAQNLSIGNIKIGTEIKAIHEFFKFSRH